MLPDDCERDCLERRVHHRRSTSIPSKESDVDRRLDNEPVFDDCSSRLINGPHEGSLWISIPHLKAETPAADP